MHPRHREIIPVSAKTPTPHCERCTAEDHVALKADSTRWYYETRAEKYYHDWRGRLCDMRTCLVCGSSLSRRVEVH